MILIFSDVSNMKMRCSELMARMGEQNYLQDFDGET